MREFLGWLWFVSQSVFAVLSGVLGLLLISLAITGGWVPVLIFSVGIALATTSCWLFNKLRRP